MTERSNVIHSFGVMMIGIIDLQEIYQSMSILKINWLVRVEISIS